MRRVMVIGLAALAMGMMGACGDGNIGDVQGASNAGARDSVQGLVIDENTEAVLRGRLGTADGQLSFFATSQGTTTILMARINGKSFDVTLGETVVIDGHDAVLTSADRAVLQTLVDELTSRFAAATMPPRIERLLTLGTYLTAAPVGYVHARLVFADLPDDVAAAGNGVITCLTKGSTVAAVYDNKVGAVISKSVLVGSNWGRNAAGTSGNYSCMGGCGAGCGSSGRARYSQDCLNHDTCSHDLNSSGGGSDTKGCADEFTAASDDFWSSKCPSQ